jgi:hypothetical protein
MDYKMRLMIIATALLFAAPAFATALEQGTVIGTDIETVKTTLTEMGYDVRKVEMEDGNIEVYALKGAEKSEMYISPKSGEIVKIKTK